MHHVPKVLVFVAVFGVVDVVDVSEAIDGGFLLVVILGHHVEGIDIGKTIVIDVGHI